MPLHPPSSYESCLKLPSAAALEIVVSTSGFLAGTGGTTFSKPTVFVLLSIVPEAGNFCYFTSRIRFLVVTSFVPAMFV